MTLDHLVLIICIVVESGQLGSHSTNALPTALSENVCSQFDRYFVGVASCGTTSRNQTLSVGVLENHLSCRILGCLLP